ncbi:MAG: hypothetical protein ABI269_13735 [Lapillicoccus sp.]
MRIAYAIHGCGPPLLVSTCWLSHLQFDCKSPVWRHFLDDIGRFATIIRFDERGHGLSDWGVTDHSLESRIGDLEAVVDDAGLGEGRQPFALMAMAQGGPVRGAARDRPTASRGGGPRPDLARARRRAPDLRRRRTRRGHLVCRRDVRAVPSAGRGPARPGDPVRRDDRARELDTEDHVRELFGDRVSELRATKELLRVDRFSSGAEFRDFFKATYGPTIAAYRNVADDPERIASLDREIAEVADRFGASTGVMEWEYLLVVATRV